MEKKKNKWKNLDHYWLRFANTFSHFAFVKIYRTIKYPSKNSMAFVHSAVFINIFLVVFVNHSMGILNRDLMAIDINDILNEKLMPLSLIYVKESAIRHKPPDRRNTRNQTMNHLNSFADFNSAFNLMQFHRKMIQNYKCNKYIARQILTDIAPHTLHNRLGMANINTSGKYMKAKNRRVYLFVLYLFVLKKTSMM